MNVYQLFFQCLKQVLKGNGKRSVFATISEKESFTLKKLEEPEYAINYVTLKL